MASLALFCCNPREFLHRYITVDETWIHFHTPETKEHSKQWTTPGESAPKKANTVKSADMVMGTGFRNAIEIFFIDYSEKGKTINGDYYALLLVQLSKDIEEKRPHLVKKKVRLHQDNARVHTCAVAMGKLH